MFRSWGADVINMTTVPEVILAKEAGICYASIAMATDYDCWKEHEETVSGSCCFPWAYVFQEYRHKNWNDTTCQIPWLSYPIFCMSFLYESLSPTPSPPQKMEKLQTLSICVGPGFFPTCQPPASWM